MKQSREPQQSPNWEARNSHQGFMEDGFPFNEGFPRFWYSNSERLQFTVITREGRRETAVVDASTQYRAEGLNWLTWPDKRIVTRHTVIAWQEHIADK